MVSKIIYLLKNSTKYTLKKGILLHKFKNLILRKKVDITVNLCQSYATFCQL